MSFPAAAGGRCAVARFDDARQRIEAKYNDIERSLLDDFRRAYTDGDKKKMKRLASILANFKVSRR